MTLYNICCIKCGAKVGTRDLRISHRCPVVTPPQPPPEPPPTPPPSGVYTVKSSGMDDSKAFNAAMTEVRAGGGGTVYLPDAVYTAASDGPELRPTSNPYHASFILQSNVTVRGAGQQATKILRAASGYTSAFGANGPIDNWGIEDLSGTTNRTSNSNGDDGIKLFGATNGHLTRVSLGTDAAHEFNTTFMFYGCKNLVLTACKSYGRSGNIGGFVVGNWQGEFLTDGVRFVDCDSTVLGSNGLPYSFAVYNESASWPRIKNVTFEQCTAHDCAKGWYFNYVSRPTVVNSKCVNVTEWQWYMTNVDALWFAGNLENGVAAKWDNGGNVTTRTAQ